MPEFDTDDLITVSDAADAKGCSRTTKYRELNDERLNGVEIGDRQMVVRDAAFEGFEPEFTGFRKEKYGNGGPGTSE